MNVEDIPLAILFGIMGIGFIYLFNPSYWYLGIIFSLIAFGEEIERREEESE